MAKAMYYLLRKEYAQALPHLEKGLEYNPNSSHIFGLLADFYMMYQPNTGKYLEYALKGLRLDAGSTDSVSVSNFHLRLANALAQTGFIDKSLESINKSLEHNPKNLYARYLRAFVVYAKNRDLRETRKLLQTEFNKDTTRLDILQDIAKVSFYLKEYDSAYRYYKRFNYLRELYKLDIFRHENLNVGIVYELVGETKKGKEFIENYRQYIETDQTAYKDLGLTAYYDYIGNTDKAIEHLRRFSKEDNINYWIILFMRQEPQPKKGINNIPECKKLMDEIEAKFWANHDKLKLTLEEKGLL
jgi:tetratricopeptide (TPR) repeat protein